MYIGINFPDAIVLEESNSSPMDALWTLYSKAIQNDDEDFARVMSYAARGSFKTLSASVLEVALVLHTPRNVAHLAATQDQSSKAQQYCRDMFARPYLSDFRVGQNVKKIEVRRYSNDRAGIHLPEKEWQVLDDSEKNLFERHDNYMQIVTLTLQGSNSSHTEFMCVDGDTKLLIPASGDRDRKGATARGLFGQVAGISTCGNPGSGDKMYELEVSEPKKDVFVLSVDPNNFGLRFNKILRAHRQLKSRIKVTTEGGRELICTSDHPLWVVGRGFVQAGQIKSGVPLLALGKAKSHSNKSERHTARMGTDVYSSSTAEEVVADEWEQVLLGSLMGDCGIYKKPTNNPYIQEQHCVKQGDYLSWKRSIVERKLRTIDIHAVSGYTGEDMVGFRSGCSPLLLPYFTIRQDLSGLEKLEAQGLAVWYMDDGCASNGFALSTEGWDEPTNLRISEFLKRKFGIETHILSYLRDDKTYLCLRGGVEAKRRLVELCEKYVHPSMAYKFDLTGNQGVCRYCGDTFWFYERGTTCVDCGRPECRSIQTKTFKKDAVVSVEDVGEGWVYDFTVENDHNFFSNGLLSKNCVDEVDTVPAQNRSSYEEAKNIPDPRGGLNPITLLTSTRKFSYGLVQKEIDEAAKSGLKVFHWTAVDVAQACTPDRHKPELPKVQLYVNDSELTTVSEEAYSKFDVAMQSKFTQHEGFGGCAACSLFSVCKSRLATHQTSKSPLLKPISWLRNRLKEVSTGMALTQIMCRQPDSTGLIYPKLDRAIHVKTASEIAQMVTGRTCPPGMDKGTLLRILVDRGCKFYTGMDFGFTHPFSCVTMAVWGQNAFVVDCISRSGLELDDKVAVCEHLRVLNPTIHADTEAPADIETFKRRGFQMRGAIKGRGSVKSGIEIVRMKMQPALGPPTLFFLSGDPDVEFCFQQLKMYHFVTDEAGNIADEPEKVDDDSADAIRYGIVGTFAPNCKIGLPQNPNNPAPSEYQAAPGRPQWMNDYVAKLLDGGDTASSGKPVKKGNFHFQQ